MKLALTVFTILVAVAGSIPVPKPFFNFSGLFKDLNESRNLHDELNEFRKFIPFAKLESLVYQYFAADEEFQEFAEYLSSNESKNMLLEVEAVQEVKDFLRYIYDNGDNIYDTLNIIHQFLGLDKYQPLLAPSLSKTGGLAGFFNSVDALIPKQILAAVYKEEMKNSQVFRDYVKYLASSKYKPLYEKVLAIHRVQNFIDYLEKKSVDLQKFTIFFKAYFGFKIEA